MGRSQASAVLVVAGAPVVLSELAALVFPAVCPGCGRAGEPVCAACAAGLRPAPIAPPPYGVDDWVAAFAYEGVARELVARLKYRNARAALGFLARAVAAAARAGAGTGEQPGLVTWVPTTPERRRRRGFDHAELLARAAAAELGLPARGLLRRLPGPPQTGRARAARRTGPRFMPRSARRRDPSGSGPSILLIDDVSTTGASLSAAAVTLRASGAELVRAATVARTPGRGR